MRYGIYDSRVSEDKIKKPKAVSIGPTVMLDAERCILCSRCVRFCDEVSKTSELGIVNRGDHSEIQVFPDKELDNPYSGNVVDICPVGALTDKDFRFKIRVWYLKSADSLCNGCARGCNISVQYNLDRPHHGKGERVKRLKPRYNEHVNQWWMCDEGRYGYKFHDQNRIEYPIRREAGGLKETDWAAILPEVVHNIQTAKDKIGVFISPQLSNEEIFLAQKLFSEGLKLKNVFLVSPNPLGFQDDVLIRADKNPNSKGAECMGFSYQENSVKEFFSACEKGSVEGIVVFGQDLLTLPGAQLSQNGFQKLKWSLFVGSNHNVMSEYASHVLPAATYVEKEGTFTNFQGRTQKFDKVLEPLGEARSEQQILIHLAKQLGIHLHYDRAEEVFAELASKVEGFRGLSYEKLNEGTTNVRKFAAPLIPELVQGAGLIFSETVAHNHSVITSPEGAK